MHSNQTLPQLLEKQRNWMLLSILKNLSLHDRVTTLSACFTEAAKRRDDKAASELWPYVMQAVQDHVMLDPQPEPLDDWRTAVLESGTRQADFAEAIYATLPKRRMGKDSMMQTKKALLAQVALDWKETNSEEQADERFTFLMKVAEWGNGDAQQEQDLVVAAIREITAPGFDPKRLARALLELSGLEKPYSHHRYELHNCMVHGVVKSLGVERFAQGLRTLGPVMFGTDAAMARLKRVSEQVAELDELAWSLVSEAFNVRELNNSRRTHDGKLYRSSQSPPDGYRHVEGEVSLEFTESTMDPIKLILRRDATGVSGFDMRTMGHEAFASGKHNVREWQKSHHVGVSLRVEVLSGTDGVVWSVEETLFARQD